MNLRSLTGGVASFSLGSAAVAAGALVPALATAGSSGSTPTLLAALLGALGGGVAGNVAHDALKSSWDKVGDTLSDASKAGALPANHDFARAARRAQLAGHRYILLDFRRQVRADPAGLDEALLEKLIAAGLRWVDRESGVAEDSQFFAGAPMDEALRELRPILSEDDEQVAVTAIVRAALDAAWGELVEGVSEEVGEGVTSEGAAGVGGDLPEDLKAQFFAEDGGVGWFAAAEAFFIEDIKTNERLQTVMLLDRSSDIKATLSRLERFVRASTGPLGERLDAIDERLARMEASDAARSLALYLRSADFNGHHGETLDRLIAARTPPVAWQSSRAAAAVAHIIAGASTDFVGRDEPMNLLDETLRAGTYQLKLVFAGAGLGKTSFLAKWVGRRERAGALVARHFIAAGEPVTTEPDIILRHLAAQLAPFFADAPPPAADGAMIADWLHHVLSEAHPDHPIIMVIDGLDEATKPLPNFLPPSLGDGNHVIISCRSEAGDMPPMLVPWINTPLFKSSGGTVPLAPFTEQEVIAFCRRADAGGDLQAAAALRALRRISQGIPLFLKLLLPDAISGRLATLADEAVPVATFEDYVRAVIEGLDRGSGWTAGERFVFAALTQVRGPIGARDLDATLKLARAVGADVAGVNIHALDPALRRWLAVEGRGSEQRLRFVHPSLSRVFAATLGYRAEDAAAALLALCRNWQAAPSDYADRYAPDHLVDAWAAGQAALDQDEVAAIFVDARYLSRRGTAEDIERLSRQLAQADERGIPIGPWRAAFARDLTRIAALENQDLRYQLWCDKLAHAAANGAPVSASAGADRPIAICAMPVGQPGVWTGHSGWVLGAFLNAEGNQVISWAADGTVRRWSLDGTALGTFKARGGDIAGLIERPGGGFVLWGRKSFEIWDPGDTFVSLHTSERFLFGISTHPDNEHLLIDEVSELHWNDLARYVFAIGSGVRVELAGDEAQLACRLLDLDPASFLDRYVTSIRTEFEGSDHTPFQQALTTAAYRPCHWRDGAVVMALSDGQVQVWDAQQNLVAVLAGHENHVVDMGKSHDDLVVTRTLHGHVRLWSLTDGTSTRLGGDDYAAIWVCFVHDRSMLLTCDYDHVMSLWSLDGERVATMAGHRESVTSVCELPDRAGFLSWSCDDTLRRWSSDGAPCDVLLGHDNDISGALILPDGAPLSWSRDGSLRRWPVAISTTGEFSHGWLMTGAIIQADGQTFLSRRTDGMLQRWDRKGALLAERAAHIGAIWGIKVHPDDGICLSWGADGLVKRWRDDLTELNAFQTGAGTVRRLSVLAGQGQVCTLGDDMIVRWWTTDGVQLAEADKPRGYTGLVSMPRTARITAWPDGEEPHIFDPGGRYVGKLATREHLLPMGTVLPWDDVIVTWDRGGQIDTWGPSGEHLASVLAHSDHVVGVAPGEGRSILSWGLEGVLHRWAPATGEARSFGQHDVLIEGALDLGGKIGILSWARDGVMKRWDHDGALVATFAGHTDGIEGAIAVSGGRLLSWGIDETVRLWRLDGTCCGIASPFAGPIIEVVPMADGVTLGIVTRSGFCVAHLQ